jgi:hypothetical protein
LHFSFCILNYSVLSMSHPLVLGLFETAAAAAAAARELRALGIPAQRVSIVARTHDEEGSVAREADATPGSELEDSRVAGRLGELSAHLLAAVAIGVPGIGPVVADGPLAAGLGEAAGHAGGALIRTLESVGLTRAHAEQCQRAIAAGGILVAAHVGADRSASARDVLVRAGAGQVMEGTWRD